MLGENTPDQNETSSYEQVTLVKLGHLWYELPEKQKGGIEAIYIDGKSQQEIADELAIPLGTVKSRTRLALQRLKGMLSEYD